jgi:hypothetical protein
VNQTTLGTRLARCPSPSSPSRHRTPRAAWLACAVPILVDSVGAQPILLQPSIGARSGPAMAFDSIRNELIVTGGTQDLTGATWRNRGAGWVATDSPVLGNRARKR